MERQLESLRRDLDSASLKKRRAAVAALSAVPGAEPIKLLRQMLERPREPARRAAIDALVRIGTPAAIGGLIAALSHPNASVRILVLRALGDVLHSTRYQLSRGSAWFQKRTAPRLFSVISERLTDEDVRVRRNAAALLHAMEAQRVQWAEESAEADQFDDDGGDERRPPPLLLGEDASVAVSDFDMVRGLESLGSPAVLPAPPEGRHADLTLMEDGAARTRVKEGHALQVERWYKLEVAVRVTRTGLPREDGSNEPILEPKQPGDITLLVTVQGDGFEVEEPVDELVLPPIGDTPEPAVFRIRPIRKTTTVADQAQLRVRLFYDFNLIETLILTAEVVGPFEAPEKPRLGLRYPIAVRQDRREVDYLDLADVKPRTLHIDVTADGQGFQFTFTFATERTRQFELTAPLRVSREELEDALVAIREMWYDIALGKTFAEKVEGDEDEFGQQLKRLARAGRNLWVLLFQRSRGSALYKIGRWLEQHPIKPDGIVQISVDPEAAQFVFPWALLYDRPIPRGRRELPTPDGFWGVRYNIEQRLPRIQAASDTPVEIKDALKLDVLQWDQFRNIGLQNALLATLREKGAERIAISAPTITDAETAYNRLADCDAHMLYFYTHGYTRRRQADVAVGADLTLFLARYENLPADSPSRETYRLLYESIKKKQFELDRSWIELSIGKLYLDELYEYVETLASRPVVMLNMCESAQVTPALSDSFIHFFLDRGALAVLGTECPMTVEFAHPFSERVLNDLLSGSPVGSSLLAARRHFMGLRNPLGLAYTLFGSTTARFVPPPIAPAPVASAPVANG